MSTEAELAYTRGVLEVRRMYAQAFADITERAIHEVDFTAERFRSELRSRWFERRCLADGAAPAVGQRVVKVFEIAKSWGLAHAYDEQVHEITSLLRGDTHLVECASEQIGVAMLRLAPPASVVTCRSCMGWREQRERWRIDEEVFRERQVAERLVALDAPRRALREALTDMLARFAPSDDGLSEAEMAVVARARELLGPGA